VHATEGIEGETKAKATALIAEEIQWSRNARIRNEAEDVEGKMQRNEGEEVEGKENPMNSSRKKTNRTRSSQKEGGKCERSNPKARRMNNARDIEFRDATKAIKLARPKASGKLPEISKASARSRRGRKRTHLQISQTFRRMQ
jgi:hypothetical protein